VHGHRVTLVFEEDPVWSRLEDRGELDTRLGDARRRLWRPQDAVLPALPPANPP